MRQATILKTVDVFGWRAHKMLLPSGHSYGLLVIHDAPRESIGTVTLFTKGRVTGVNATTGQPLDDRVPGTLSTALGPLQKGRRVLTAQEDSEWWCIDKKVNAGELPEVSLVHVSAGQTVPGLCLVCTGQDEGQAHDTFTAKDDCMVLVFDRRRA